MAEITSLELVINQVQEMDLLLGTHDKNIKMIEEATTTTIRVRGERIQIQGEKEQANKALKILQALQELIDRGIAIGRPDVISAVNLANQGALDSFIGMYEKEILKDYNGKAIRAKNLGQKRYIQAVQKHDVTFGIGPAGTGKTFLAVVLAIAALKKGQVKRIILTRPAVEAGENLGFLPGDLKEKVDPYLRPVYDALYQVFGVEHTNRLMERGVVEIAPLAYMRGRTLDDAFVILDEAQNTTIAQMKMFLTRLGFNSRMIVNGDISQIDLPKGQISGLVDAQKTLQEVKKIAFVHFTAQDVVRHPVVAQIIAAYDKAKE